MRGSRSLIAIVGRPNVGKSTLFNRLLGRKRAIVEDLPGATRDRHYADAELDDGHLVTWIDTGGFVPEAKEEALAHQIRLQAQVAVEECDVVIFVVDARAGVTSGDQEIAQYLRSKRAQVIVAANKIDGGKNADVLTADFHSLGLGDPLAVSAEHGDGAFELKDAVIALLPALPPVVEVDEADEAVPEKRRDRIRGRSGAADTVRIAIVGRPNVGKSTLVNALTGQNRVITSPIAGTTRDPIDTELTWQGRQIVLTDTAGIRRKSVISQKVEQFSVLGALRAVEDSDVAVLVIDATEPAVEQDLKIAGLAEEKGRALLICVNKWDIGRDGTTEERFREGLKWYMKFVGWAPMVFVSAIDGKKVNKVLDVALELFDQQHFRAPTPMLNKVVKHVTTEHPLPVIAGKQLRLYYAAQVATAPPAFAFMTNLPKSVPDRYQRYVSNYLRETFRLRVPIRLFWRERPGKEKRAQAAQRFKARARHQRK